MSGDNWKFSKSNYDLLIKRFDDLKEDHREAIESLKEEMHAQNAALKTAVDDNTKRIGNLEQWKSRLLGAWGAVTFFVLYVYNKIVK